MIPDLLPLLFFLLRHRLAFPESPGSGCCLKRVYGGEGVAQVDLGKL